MATIYLLFSMICSNPRGGARGRKGLEPCPNTRRGFRGQLQPPKGAAHVAPVFLDTDRSVDKACSVIAEAAGARLIAFPEAFLPGFPVWAALAATILTHELFKGLAASAVEIDRPELARIRQTARQQRIFVSIGFTEGTKTSVGCLWNANALIGADGTLLQAVDRETFNGDVFSMEVEGYGHYIADGLVTHNCFYGWREGAAHQFFGPANATDLWAVKKVNPQSMIHLTEKPVELAQRAMEYSSKRGENVLDLFGGSGSTLIAAQQSGRKAFLMELDPLYCDVIVQRFEQFTGQKANRS
jgi:DNA methylase/Carbon-nitrogen hydrolase